MITIEKDSILFIIDILIAKKFYNLWVLHKALENIFSRFNCCRKKCGKKNR